MKLGKIRSEFVLSLLCAMVSLVVAGCYYGPPPPPPPPPGPPVAGPVVEPAYDYYYYPDEEVYFYPATGVYFWFGGGGWHTGRRLPAGFVLHADSRVNIRLNTLRPYERHEEIRARYPHHFREHERER